jgi:hypothetical protein
MAPRGKLELVDDPIAGVKRTDPPPQTAAKDAEPDRPARPRRQPRAKPDARQAEAVSTPPSAPQPAGSYAREEKRAVFGRVPRSLSRRLERAVVELRDEFENLTQEQVLAALLHAHVDPADPAALAALTETVRRYRRELTRE